MNLAEKLSVMFNKDANSYYKAGDKIPEASINLLIKPLTALKP